MTQAKRTTNKFNNFSQRNYDFAELERKLLDMPCISPSVAKKEQQESIKPFVKMPKALDDLGLSAGATKLYFHLLVLQDRYKLKNGNTFYHTLQQLVDEMGHAKGSIEKWQKELISAKLISTEKKHFRNGDKISENRTTYYTIL